MKRVVKTLIIFISLFMFTNEVFASEPKMVWRNFLKEEKINYLFIDVDTYNGEYYYVGGAGSDNTVINASTASAISSDYEGLVLKYDKDGNLLWQDYPDGVSTIYKIKSTSDGGFVTLGKNDTQPSGTELANSTMFKYDKNGKIEWKVEIQTLDNYIELADNGTYYGNVEIYNDENGNYIIVIGTGSVNIVVVSKDGKVNRIFNTDSLNDDDNIDLVLSSYTMDDDNHIVLFGIKYNETTKEQKLVMYKFDTNGYLVSDKEIGTLNDEFCNLAMATDINNNYVALILTHKENNYNYDFNIYDKSGKMISSKKLDMTKRVEQYYVNKIFKLDIDLENNYLVSYYENGFFNQERYDENLNQNWNYDRGELYPYGFVIDKYNNYIYVGGKTGFVANSLNSSKEITTYDYQIFASIMVDIGYIDKFTTSYNISVTKEGVGEVESSVSTATAGDTVTIKATPGDGYRIDKITVTDKFGNNIEVVDNKFVMPASDVTIKVVFTNAPIENPKTGTMDIVGASVIFILLGIAGYQYIKSKQMIGL